MPAKRPDPQGIYGGVRAPPNPGRGPKRPCPQRRCPQRRCPQRRCPQRPDTGVVSFLDNIMSQ
jgi:hypothetical protein